MANLYIPKIDTYSCYLLPKCSQNTSVQILIPNNKLLTPKIRENINFSMK